MENFRKGIALVVVLCLTILGLGIRWGEAASPEITLRYAGNLPMDHFITRSQNLYAKLVMEKTNGKVKVEVYPTGQLFIDKDLVKALPAGAVDMAEVTCAQWTGIVPLWLYLDLALFFKDRDQWHKAIDSPIGDILKEEFEKKSGVKVLYWMDFGSSAIASKMPLRKLEDFKGKRIRGTGEIVLEAIKALGAAPVFMGGGEVYLALQRGTIDGANSGVSSFVERKYYEVTKYITLPDMTLGMFATLINKKKWDTLPPDVQKAMLEAAEEAKLWTRKECEKSDKEGLVILKEKGMDIYDPPEQEKARWRAACKPLVDIFVKRAGEKSKVLLEMTEKIQ
jgi:tripartite ATP-independent transporter DctP family solute receptor